MNLPSSDVLCKVLLNAEKSITPLKIKKDYLPILQAILPEIYGSKEDLLESTTISNSLSSSSPLVLLSGGLGSCASLWRVLTYGRDPSIVFVENLFQANLELKRRNCVANIMLESRTCTGNPLIDMTTNKSWLSSLSSPTDAKKLSR